MPHTKSRTIPEVKSTSWKNSLLNKEKTVTEQNPMNYFDKIVEDNDEFAEIWEHILKARDNKASPMFNLQLTTMQPVSVVAFIVVQDRRGVHLVCPLFENDGFYGHALFPMKLEGEHAIDTRLDDDPIGAVCIAVTEYVGACSRGFENASATLLGGKAIELKPDYRVVGVFHTAVMS